MNGRFATLDNHLNARPQWRALAIAVLLLTPNVARADRWHDDFSGVPTQLPSGETKRYPDLDKWFVTFRPGAQWPQSFGDGVNWLQGNREAQVYLSPFAAHGMGGVNVAPRHRYDPFSIDKDGLHIRAAELSAEQRDAYGLGAGTRYGSGLLVSRRSFKYGRFTLRAKLPSAEGTWPAFWLLPESGGWPPEIDVMEGMAWRARARSIHTGIIAAVGEGQKEGGWFKVDADPAGQFNDYTLEWTEKKIVILFNGKELLTDETPPSMQQPMYLLINLAVGGQWAYDELGVPGHGDKSEKRMNAGAESIRHAYPAEMIVKSISVDDVD